MLVSHAKSTTFPASGTMSESMDFSDMFRRTDGDSAKQAPTKPRLTSMKRAPEEGVSFSQENVPPTQQQINAESDSMVYVKNALRNMNHDLQTKDLTPAALKAIEMLFSEKGYWQEQASSVSDECMKVRSSLAQMQRDKARDSDIIESLKKENQQSLMRISALTMEHREVKNHWLAEKSDLQTRIFQVQALNTQASGSLKKCEKDFVKLQNQLAKIVKDGNKAQAKPAIMMSLPVKKNLSQESGAQGSAASILKDSELLAAKKTIATLDTENQTLRSSMDALKRNMDELTDSLETSVRLSETKTREQLEIILAEHTAALDAKEVQIADLQQKLSGAQQESDLQRVRVSAVDRVPVAPTPVKQSAAASVAATPVAATPQRTAKAPATPSTKAQEATKVEFLSPSLLRNSVKFRAVATPGSIAKRYLEGTPGARPVQWVVEQANTEVKRLRERAEQIARGDAGAAAAVTAATLAGRAEENAADMDAGTSAMWRMKINAMKLHLSEALAVIQEQDRLIHSALIGRPVGMNAEGMDLSALALVEDKLLEAPEDQPGETDAKKEVLDHLEHFGSLKDSDFLPPASPDTLALLQSYGWSCLPAKMSAVDAPSPYAGAISEAEATTLVGEFDAED